MGYLELMVWFRLGSLVSDFVQSLGFIFIVFDDLCNNVHFFLSFSMVEIVGFNPVDVVSYGGHFVFQWMARVMWDNGVSDSVFSKNVVGKPILCPGYCEV
jgi:hypothetical protein